jgi:hypothetical protein
MVATYSTSALPFSSDIGSFAERRIRPSFFVDLANPLKELTMPLSFTEAYSHISGVAVEAFEWLCRIVREFVISLPNSALDWISQHLVTIRDAFSQGQFQAIMDSTVVKTSIDFVKWMNALFEDIREEFWKGFYKTQLDIAVQEQSANAVPCGISRSDGPSIVCTSAQYQAPGRGLPTKIILLAGGVWVTWRILKIAKWALVNRHNLPRPREFAVANRRDGFWLGVVTPLLGVVFAPNREIRRYRASHLRDVLAGDRQVDVEEVNNDEAYYHRLDDLRDEDEIATAAIDERVQVLNVDIDYATTFLDYNNHGLINFYDMASTTMVSVTLEHALAHPRAGLIYFDMQDRRFRVATALDLPMDLVVSADCMIQYDVQRNGGEPVYTLLENRGAFGPHPFHATTLMCAAEARQVAVDLDMARRGLHRQRRGGRRRRHRVRNLWANRFRGPGVLSRDEAYLARQLASLLRLSMGPVNPKSSESIKQAQYTHAVRFVGKMFTDPPTEKSDGDRELSTLGELCAQVQDMERREAVAYYAAHLYSMLQEFPTRLAEHRARSVQQHMLRGRLQHPNPSPAERAEMERAALFQDPCAGQVADAGETLGF